MEMKSIPEGTTVLVTGATGFTGSVLVKKLVQANLNVRAIARHSSNTEPFKGLNIEWYRGNVFDAELIKEAMQGVEYVFHIAAAYREAKLEDRDYFRVHVESTQHLAREAIKQNNFKRFLHTSTVGVHGHIENPPANEDSPFNPGDIYQKTKLEGELWIREFAEKNGLPLTVIRPAAIYGPGDRRLLKLFKMAASGWFPLIGGKNTLYHLIHVEDLTNFFIFCATHPEAENDVFICGNRSHVELKQMVTTIAEVYHKKVKFVKLPAAPLFMLGDICEFICKRLGVEPPIYRRRIAFFTKDRSFDTRKMHEKLKFNPIYDNLEGIKQTAQWYLDHNWIKVTS